MKHQWEDDLSSNVDDVLSQNFIIQHQHQLSSLSSSYALDLDLSEEFLQIYRQFLRKKVQKKRRENQLSQIQIFKQNFTPLLVKKSQQKQLQTETQVIADKQKTIRINNQFDFQALKLQNHSIFQKIEQLEKTQKQQLEFFESRLPQVKPNHTQPNNTHTTNDYRLQQMVSYSTVKNKTPQQNLKPPQENKILQTNQKPMQHFLPFDKQPEKETPKINQSRVKNSYFSQSNQQLGYLQLHYSDQKDPKKKGFRHLIRNPPQPLILRKQAHFQTSKTIQAGSNVKVQTIYKKRTDTRQTNSIHAIIKELLRMVDRGTVNQAFETALSTQNKVVICKVMEYIPDINKLSTKNIRTAKEIAYNFLSGKQRFQVDEITVDSLDRKSTQKMFNFLKKKYK